MNEISSITCIIIAFLFLLIPANNAFTASALNSPESICNATPRPAFCIEGLEPMSGFTFHDVARQSFKYSLYITQNMFYPHVDRAFYKLWESLGSVSPENPMLYALGSCEALIRKNKRILFRTLQQIKCRDKVENPSEAQSLTNLLRSVVRNHETCFDALTGAVASANNATNAMEIEGILSDRSAGSESYNETLELFMLGWGQDHQDQITHSAPRVADFITPLHSCIHTFLNYVPYL